MLLAVFETAACACVGKRTFGRTCANAKNILAYPGLATSERMTGPEGSVPPEEAIMTLKPFDGREVGGKTRTT